MKNSPQIGLTEYTEPLLVGVENRRNTTDLLFDRLKSSPDHPAFNVPTDSGWRDVSTREYAEDVTSLAKGLMAAGLEPGDSLALMAATSYQWAVIDLAGMTAGAVVVPIFDSASTKQVHDALIDANVKFAFAETAEQFEQMTKTVEEEALPVKVWRMVEAPDGFASLRELGKTITDEQLEKRRLTATMDDIATIVYSSGTEGASKGALITHGNLVGKVLNVEAGYSEVVYEAGSTLIFLPLAHVLARGLQLVCLAAGMTISHEAVPKKAIAALSEVKPTFLVVVPRVLQKVQENAALLAKEKHIGWMWTQAEKTAVEWGELMELQQKDPDLKPSLSLKLRHAFYEKLFFKRIRTLFGGQIDYVLSGAAPLARELGLQFRGMGIEVIEGYGLTETTAPLTGNRPGDNYSGTVGRPQAGNTVRISETGEILGKGIGVFSGYTDPEKDKEAFEDGFFRTGDLGFIDDGGHVTITGRVKDIIVTSGGKTISPQAWEQAVEDNPLVAHAVVVGDERPYPTALLVLDPEKLEEIGFKWTEKAESLTSIEDKGLEDQIRGSIDYANTLVSKPEKVQRFRLVAGDLEPGTALATPTMKLRRREFLSQAGPLIEKIYEGSQT